MIAFGLIYWELDRGGPCRAHAEAREELPLADFRFSQDENDDTVIEVAAGVQREARAGSAFVDYLYLSADQLQRVQPDRHHAADQPREDR